MEQKIISEKNFVIAIAGGSGSGKTTLAKGLQKKIGLDRSLIISQDSYYLDQSKYFDHDGGNVNFDHPQAIDFPLMAEHILQLKLGRSILVPMYDFITHTRKSEGIKLDPKPVILVDGILILSQSNVRITFDYSIFIDTEESVRFERRLRRDLKERGRSEQGVREQFYKQVKPMHDAYVEPSKQFANYIRSGNDPIEIILEDISEQLPIKNLFSR